MANIALVTGGSRGIGAACAVQLAQRGYDVAFSYLRRADKARQNARARRVRDRSLDDNGGEARLKSLE